MSSSLRVSSLVAVAAAVMAAAAFGPGAQAQVVSFNFTQTSNPLAAGELAGAPGVRVANWNNGTGNDIYWGNSYSFASSALVDDSGSLVAGLSLSVTGGYWPFTWTSGLNNDAHMFNTMLDLWNSDAASISLSGISYASYDAYFYLYPDAGSTTARGGHVTIGDTTYFVNGGNGANSLSAADDSGAGYVLSTATTLADSLAAPGNYVKFSGLTGDSLTASLVADNFGDGVPRLKIAGFQIVAVPEPATLALVGCGLVGALLRTRRTRQ
jgi:hypothetical protein